MKLLYYSGREFAVFIVSKDPLQLAAMPKFSKQRRNNQKAGLLGGKTKKNNLNYLQKNNVENQISCESPVEPFAREIAADMESEASCHITTEINSSRPTSRPSAN